MDELGFGTNMNALGLPSSETLCRICSRSYDYLIPVFSGEGKQHRLDEKMNKFLPLKISQKDKLPTKVCYQCASTLLAWSDLIETCIEANNKLKSLILLEAKELENRRKTLDKHVEEVVKVDETPKYEPSDNSRESFVDSDDISSSPEKSSSRKKKRKEAYCRCLICGKSFQYVDYLKSHLSSHSKERPFACPFCDATFKRKDNVSQHKMAVHSSHPDVIKEMEEKGRTPISCEKCGEVKPNKQQMLWHLKKHEIHSSCDICGKTFIAPSSLKEHLSSDHAEISYNCSLCAQTIKTGRELYIHKQKHYISYICDVCGKSFSVSSSLRTHMVLHSDDKPFTCNECGKSFKLKARLHFHQQSHLDIRPYACSICPDKRFKTKTALIVHNNMHTDNRPYPCTYCSFRARKNSDLVCHIRTHTGEKPYKCDVCDRGFAQAGDMRKHRALHDKNRI